MAGTSQAVTRIWAKTASAVGASGGVIDALKAFFDSINNLVADAEAIRQSGQASVFSTAGLVIKAGSSALAKAGTAFRYVTLNSVAGGVLKYNLMAANTDMAALVGSVTNAKFNVFVFSVAFDGTTVTLATRMGVEGATRGAVVFPTVPANEAIIGFVEINPTGAGSFVGGTTALDDGTVIPNAVYVNFTGGPSLGATAAPSGLVTSALTERQTG